MAATTLLTVEEFLKMPLKEGIKYELVHGQVVETNVMGTARRFHERVKANCIRLLVAYILQHPLGEVFSETAFMLTEDLMCIPDISVIRQDRLGGDQNTLYEGSPALAIEVVSSDAAADLERKIEDYLAYGSQEAWVVYPEQKVIRTYRRDGHSILFKGDDRVEAADVLPGFSIPASDFFAGI